MAEDDSGLRVVLKEFPPGAGSLVGSQAALASRDQGKYLAFHKALFASGGRIDEEKVMKVADSVGLDTARLKEEMETPAITAAIERNRNLAKSLGIRANPALVIGKELKIGSVGSKALKQLIARTRSSLMTNMF